MEPHDKENARKLQGSFVPAGEPIAASELLFRRTLECEVYRCCRKTAFDPQSGPIFCGQVAEFVAEIKDDLGNVTGVVGLCGKRGHVPWFRNPARVDIEYKNHSV